MYRRRLNLTQAQRRELEMLRDAPQDFGLAILKQEVDTFLGQFDKGSYSLLRYTGLLLS